MNSFIQLNTTDNVVIALRNLKTGEIITVAETPITLLTNVNFGHKVAIKPIPGNAKVIKYGLPIGSAIVDIEPGTHVHTHNLISDYNPH